MKLYDYTFRLAHVSAFEGELAAAYMKDTFGATKVSAIYSDNDWGLAVDESFAAYAEKIGLEVVANEPFIMGQTKDFSATLTKIKQAGAEAVYYMGQYTECGMVLKQIRDLGMDIKTIITTSSYKIESLELAGDAAEGVVFMAGFFQDPKNTKQVEFAERAKNEYGANIDNFILRAYDAVMWLGDAIDKCQDTDPDVLKAAICEVGEAGLDYVSGHFALNAERNVEREFYYMKWDGNKEAPNFAPID